MKAKSKKVNVLTQDFTEKDLENLEPKELRRLKRLLHKEVTQTNDNMKAEMLQPINPEYAAELWKKITCIANVLRQKIGVENETNKV